MSLLKIIIVIAFGGSLFNTLRLMMMFFGHGLSGLGYRNFALSIMVLAFSSCQLFGWFDLINYIQNYIK